MIGRSEGRLFPYPVPLQVDFQPKQNHLVHPLPFSYHSSCPRSQPIGSALFNHPQPTPESTQQDYRRRHGTIGADQFLIVALFDSLIFLPSEVGRLPPGINSSHYSTPGKYEQTETGKEHGSTEGDSDFKHGSFLLLFTPQIPLLKVQLFLWTQVDAGQKIPLLIFREAQRMKEACISPQVVNSSQYIMYASFLEKHYQTNVHTCFVTILLFFLFLKLVFSQIRHLFQMS